MRRRHENFTAARPIASGELSRREAYLLAVALFVATFAIGMIIGPEETAAIALYIVVALSYTFYWKRVPIADIFVIAGLFTFRIWLGILILDVRISPWLLVFSMFVFLSLSAAKRHTELQRWKARGPASGRGYVREDVPLLLALGVAAMLGAEAVDHPQHLGRRLFGRARSRGAAKGLR